MVELFLVGNLVLYLIVIFVKNHWGEYVVECIGL
ncbi:hypothetical protein C8E02_2263 [Vogesella indigofera]|uniref:Uncharacterized protein n=1 Tax=Vogesella indigofera TaxID=45465 RepID=A0A495BB52_VOGIN|nr:hypothetical protein C8E02_2263 [Vogesella indigofera]